MKINKIILSFISAVAILLSTSVVSLAKVVGDKIVLGAAISLIGYALLAQKLIQWIKANPKTINTISASVLVVIALIIIVTQQY